MLYPLSYEGVGRDSNPPGRLGAARRCGRLLADSTLERVFAGGCGVPANNLFQVQHEAEPAALAGA